MKEIKISRTQVSKAAPSLDKQLRSISLEAVLEKRRLDQALNAKEFAICAGVSYSTARNWFRLQGFPAFCGVVFWQDFVKWRTGHDIFDEHSVMFDRDRTVPSFNFPPKSTRLLHDMR